MRVATAGSRAVANPADCARVYEERPRVCACRGDDAVAVAAVAAVAVTGDDDDDGGEGDTAGNDEEDEGVSC